MKLRVVLIFALISCLPLFGQRQAPAPPQQSARQALIEMITGGQKAIGKHLTVEVQQLMEKSGPSAAFALGTFDQFRGQAGTDLQTFETGPMLLLINQPGEHKKLEVRVENDDLSGDEDTFELSLQVVRENSEQAPEEWEAFLSHLTVNMKKQTGVWRLNKVGINVEFPVGDPEFLKRTFLKGMQKEGGTGLVASTGRPEPTPEPVESAIPPEHLVLQLTYIEQSYARAHPDVGFTCSLSELAESAKSMGFEQQLASGIYKGYKLSLTGCQGRPAGSFQVMAEPLQGGKAFCTDATGNVRVSDDGKGSTCLAFGRIPARAEDELSVRFTQSAPEPHTEFVTPAVSPVKDKD